MVQVMEIEHVGWDPTHIGTHYHCYWMYIPPSFYSYESNLDEVVLNIFASCFLVLGMKDQLHVSMHQR